jgi:hypothetical protein
MDIFIQNKTTGINIYAKPSCWTRHNNAIVPKPKENNTPITPGNPVFLIGVRNLLPPFKRLSADDDTI